VYPLATIIIVNFLGEACKNKWKSLRESYRKAMNARKTKSGQSAKKIRPWRLESQMEFVKSYLFSQSEEEMSNFPALSPSSPTTDSNDLSSITNELLETEENEEELKNQQSDELEDSVIINNKLVNNQNNKQLFSVGKKSEIGTDKPGTAAKLLHQYMQMKMSASSNPRPSGDQLTKYFQSIEATVRTLPVNIQIKLKSQISQLVYNAEMEAVSMPTNHLPFLSVQQPNTVQQQPNTVQQQPNTVQQHPYPIQQHPYPVQQLPNPIQQQTNPVQQQSDPVQQSYVAFQPQSGVNYPTYTDLS